MLDHDLDSGPAGSRGQVLGRCVDSGEAFWTDLWLVTCECEWYAAGVVAADQAACWWAVQPVAPAQTPHQPPQGEWDKYMTTKKALNCCTNSSNCKYGNTSGIWQLHKMALFSVHPLLCQGLSLVFCVGCMHLTSCWTHAACVYSACHGVYGSVDQFLSFETWKLENPFWAWIMLSQGELAAEGVAVPGQQLGDALHPGLRRPPVRGHGRPVLEQHRAAHLLRGPAWPHPCPGELWLVQTVVLTCDWSSSASWSLSTPWASGEWGAGNKVSRLCCARLHHTADVQKYFVLRAKRGLITDGLFSRSRNPNYLGEMFIYGSFAGNAGQSSTVWWALVQGLCGTTRCGGGRGSGWWWCGPACSTPRGWPRTGPCPATPPGPSTPHTQVDTTGSPGDTE